MFPRELPAEIKYSTIPPLSHVYSSLSLLYFVSLPLSVSNYGPTISVQNEAIKLGCQQVLWLYGEQEEITEVGTMNLFIYWTNEGGGLFHCL